MKTKQTKTSEFEIRKCLTVSMWKINVSNENLIKLQTRGQLIIRWSQVSPN